jgi:4-hydroxy 2-oxovalerate aldolase
MSQHIKILDCTLRDGGYINDFYFGDEAIRGIIQYLMQSRVDIIECGFLKDGERKTGSSVFSAVSEIKPYINRKSSSLVAMIDYGRYNISQLTLFDGETIDGIRDCFFKKDRFDALDLAKNILKKGYKVYIQPVDILGYSDMEILDFVNKVNDLDIYAFSIVDTFGSMFPDDLLRIFNLLDHNLRKNVSIGLHSHNNMQLSFALSQRFTEISQGKRNVIIDCSILGMGRGAGNTPTELVVNYLNAKWNGYQYNLNALLDLIDIYMLPIRKYHTWGYDIPNYIAGIYSSHVHNVTYLLDKHNMNSKDMGIIIESIDPAARKRYDYDNLESLYVNYFSHKIDDSANVKQLQSLFEGKKILLLAPGKTLETHRTDIEEFISKNDIICVSVNFVPDNYDVTFSFFSNQKRLDRNIEFRKNSLENVQLIITSNVQIEEFDISSVFMINYTSLIKRKRWEYFDNSLILAIRFLYMINVASIYIAGADGFTINENYAENNRFLESDASRERGYIFNTEMGEMIQDIRATVQRNDFLVFITPSLYENNKY